MTKLFSDNAALDRWIQGVGQGDRDALARLYSAASAPIYAYALSILKNRHDAEDVLQDCFVAICGSAESYRSQGKPMAWMLTIARNLSYNRLQEQQRSVQLPQEESCGCKDVDPEDRLLIEGCLERLSEEERQIVVLHAVAGWKHREIGEYLELSLSTVLSKYRRAIKKLKGFCDGKE